MTARTKTANERANLHLPVGRSPPVNPANLVNPVQKEGAPIQTGNRLTTAREVIALHANKTWSREILTAPSLHQDDLPRSFTLVGTGVFILSGQSSGTPIYLQTP